MRKYLMPLVAAFVVCSGVAACGGGEGKLQADDFADETCPDLAEWGKTVTDVFGDLQGLESVTDDETVQQKLSSALGDLDRATARLASSIDDRGAPDVQNGEEIKKQMVEALNSFRDSARELRTEVDNFEVANANADDSESFSSALESFGSAADEDGASLDAFSDNSDLTNAFSDSKICEEAESQFSEFSS